MRWPRIPHGAWFVDRTSEDRARRLAGWLLARYRATGATSLSTRELLRDGPLRRVGRLDEALRLLARDGVLEAMRLGRGRWVQLDAVALGHSAPLTLARSLPGAHGGDAATRYFAALGRA